MADQQPQPLPLARETSQRIDALRFLLVIAIVVIHARGHTVEVGGAPVGPESISGAAWFLQEILSSVVARTAVPLFFLFSGLLTAASLARGGYGKLLACRARTLLIPYLFWNAIVFGLFCLASPDRLATINPLSIFGFDSLPAAYHFWFVRDLILLVLAAPLLVAVARRAPAFSALGSIALWLYAPDTLGAEGAPLATSAICFFQIGAILCFHRVALAKRWQAVAVAVYVPLAISDALVPDTALAGALFHKLVLLVGMFAIWHMGGLLSKRHPLPTVLTSSAFMVYAAHEPLLSVLRKTSYALLKPDGDLSVTAIYLLATAVTVVACIAANSLASRVAPNLHALVTGGRGLNLSQT